MKTMPRILPLIGVAMVGVLGLNAVSGANSASDLVSGARAFAEEAAKGVAPKAKAEEKAATGQAADTAAKAAAPTVRSAAVCAPTAAELAKEAGLSPAELQVLQSLGARRGQLDKREQDLDVQIALLAAAEAKLDAKTKALNGLKAEVQNLMSQADAKEEAEIDRLVKVFEGMKPKDAAPRIVMLDDEVRLPIAAKMKERALSAILAQMPAAEAKKLTESLASRYAAVRKAAAAAQAAEAPKPAQQAQAPAPKAAAPAPKGG
ncbi:MAG: MotE family protein [Phenylobacterium sp.]|uniref:MotE family protein n=1 Tax=Phenylobacterium sp. TaxID=1871053 RepID=UPI00391D9B20